MKEDQEGTRVVEGVASKTGPLFGIDHSPYSCYYSSFRY